MNHHLLRFLFLLIFASQNVILFSQGSIKGTYHLVSNPMDALAIPKRDTLEFPVYFYKASVELKIFKKLKYTSFDLSTDSTTILKGTWSISGNTIKLLIQINGLVDERVFELVKLKSGQYIKPVNDYFHYYKKE